MTRARWQQVVRERKLRCAVREQLAARHDVWADQDELGAAIGLRLGDVVEFDAACADKYSYVKHGERLVVVRFLGFVVDPCVWVYVLPESQVMQAGPLPCYRMGYPLFEHWRRPK